MLFLVPILIIVLSAGFGIYFLITDPTPELAVHFFLLTLYFFLTIHEARGEPFSKSVYYLLIFLLVANGIALLFFFSKHLISGIISLFFAYSAWNATKRLH